jgi:transcriptional regulator with XRE-family HTH domain
VAKPKLKTTVSVLRSTIGMSAKKFAGLIGRSIHTVKSVESGRLALSADLAKIVSHETGVDAHWLLDGNAQIPPYSDIVVREYFSTRRKKHSKDFKEASYSKEFFDRVRAMRLAKESPEGEHTREEQMICLLFRLLCIYESARVAGEDMMALYRLHGFEGDLAEHFGLSLDEPAFELALKAGRSLQKLTTRLKRDQKDLSALSFGPGKVDPVNDTRPVKFLQFRHRTAKAMRAINEPRKGNSKARGKKVPSKKGIEAQVSAATPRRAAH